MAASYQFHRIGDLVAVADSMLLRVRSGRRSGNSSLALLGLCPRGRGCWSSWSTRRVARVFVFGWAAGDQGQFL